MAPNLQQLFYLYLPPLNFFIIKLWKADFSYSKKGRLIHFWFSVIISAKASSYNSPFYSSDSVAIALSESRVCLETCCFKVSLERKSLIYENYLNKLDKEISTSMILFLWKLKRWTSTYQKVSLVGGDTFMRRASQGILWRDLFDLLSQHNLFSLLFFMFPFINSIEVQSKL